MTYKVTRTVGRTTTRSFNVTHVVGRATSNRSFRVTHIVGRATSPPVAGGTFKLTRVVGRARVSSAPTGSLVEPFQAVQLPDGVWSQISGPAVFINSVNQFIAPAVPDGADLLFQAGSSSTTFHVNPHTVFRIKSSAMDPLFASTHPEQRPVVT
jgi:hypothetical protein